LLVEWAVQALVLEQSLLLEHWLDLCYVLEHWLELSLVLEQVQNLEQA
jgi:hypothetical protein